MGRFTAGNNADAERKERFFNAKQRLIGVRNQAARIKFRIHQTVCSVSKWHCCVVRPSCAPGGCPGTGRSGGGQEEGQGAGESRRAVSDAHV